MNATNTIIQEELHDALNRIITRLVDDRLPDLIQLSRDAGAGLEFAVTIKQDQYRRLTTEIEKLVDGMTNLKV